MCFKLSFEFRCIALYLVTSLVYVYRVGNFGPCGLFGRSSPILLFLSSLRHSSYFGIQSSYSLTGSHVLKGPVVRIGDRALLARAYVEYKDHLKVQL